MFDSASRFSATDQPAMQPAKDLITGATSGMFVDTGRDIQFAETGRVYLSIDTVREMAEGLGLFDDIRNMTGVAESVARNDGYVEGLNSHGDIVALADRIADAADRVRSSAPASAPVTSAGADEDEGAVRVTDGVVGQRAGGTEPAQRRTRQQGNGARRSRRPAGVSSGSGDGSNPFRI